MDATVKFWQRETRTGGGCGVGGSKSSTQLCCPAGATSCSSKIIVNSETFSVCKNRLIFLIEHVLWLSALRLHFGLVWLSIADKCVINLWGCPCETLKVVSLCFHFRLGGSLILKKGRSEVRLGSKTARPPTVSSLLESLKMKKGTLVKLKSLPPNLCLYTVAVPSIGNIH